MCVNAQAAGRDVLKALKLYDCVIEKDAQVFSNIGAARHALGDFKSAITALNTAATLAPHEIAYNRKGRDGGGWNRGGPIYLRELLQG